MKKYDQKCKTAGELNNDPQANKTCWDKFWDKHTPHLFIVIIFLAAIVVRM
jgi:hypothetical protein